MSLLMMINKIQSAEDFRRFAQSPPEEIDRILENTTESIRRTIRDIMYSLLMKMNVPVEEANQYVEMVEECHMGYLFENIEKMDIQAERRNTAQARKEAEEAKQKAEEAEQKMQRVIKTIISMSRNQGSTRRETIVSLVEQYGFSHEEAESSVDLFWTD
ncbi:MAG: hypothetical protein LUF32_07215 [Clostridiales bacterium]|nr:hypothetical protein [Clostridiales bacterium]